MKNKLSLLYDKLKGENPRKDVGILFLSVIDKDLPRFFEENLASKTYENLFFRQFFFLFKQRSKQDFLKNILQFVKYKDIFIKLEKYYHFELLYRDFQTEEDLLRVEIFDILEYHQENFISNFNKYSFEEGILKLDSFSIFTVYDEKSTYSFDLCLQVFNNTLDLSDCINGFSISIYMNKKEVYGLTFYIGNDVLLISNIQKIGSFSDIIYLLNYNKILLFVVLEISNNLNKLSLGFSNKNHPCRFHQVGHGFNGNYDNIFNSIGMFTLDGNYFKGESLKIKKINPIIIRNLSYISNVFTEKIKTIFTY